MKYISLRWRAWWRVWPPLNGHAIPKLCMVSLGTRPRLSTQRDTALRPPEGEAHSWAPAPTLFGMKAHWLTGRLTHYLNRYCSPFYSLSSCKLSSHKMQAIIYYHPVTQIKVKNTSMVGHSLICFMKSWLSRTVINQIIFFHWLVLWMQVNQPASNFLY